MHIKRGIKNDPPLLFYVFSPIHTLDRTFCLLAKNKLECSGMPLPIEQNILLYILIGCAVLLILWIVRLELKVRKLTAGKDGKSLEDSITLIKKGWDLERKFKEEMQQYLLTVEKRISRSIRGFDTVRFNAFQGTSSGGNQSFATCYLNEKGDGVIISSLNAHERVSIFSKPVKAFASEQSLTPEEQQALERAKASLKL